MLLFALLFLSFLFATIVRSSKLHGPDHKPPHPNRTEGETMFAFRELSLTIQENEHGKHSVHQLAHRFNRLKHPHSNPDLWHYVKDICSVTWKQIKPDDHHFAATVDIHNKKVNCWSAYHEDDVIEHDIFEGHTFVTYLPSIEALGTAPRGLWFTDKWDVHYHGPYYKPDGHDSADL
jgi:hypothetical protein